MFNKAKTDVLVVGAGPVGLFTALQLAERGIDVQIVEEQWRTAARSYALALHPATLQLLSQVRLADQLIASGNRVETVGLYGGGRLRKKLEFSALGGSYPFILVLPQRALEEALRERLEAKGVKVLWNHRVAGINSGDDGVETRIERLGKESTGYSVARTEWIVEKLLEFRSDFVIGADGHRSLVRRALDIDYPKQGEALNFAVFEFKTAGNSGVEVGLVLDENSTSVLWPLSDGCFRWSFEMPESEGTLDSRVKSRLLVQFRDEPYPHVSDERLTEYIQERAPWFDAEITEVEWSAAIRFERRLAEPFGRGRGWLVGDAAHIALPVGIQSMNIGLREASDLVAKMDQVLRAGAVLDTLESYNDERIAEWKNLLGLSSRVESKAGADPWIERNASRIPTCLPASGADLEALLGQVGLQIS
jgi:2-polyprenyl-6-methoxyphenol hydroxylase-like FAD-dependent oxidoreductase